MARTLPPVAPPSSRTAADLLVACLEAEGCEYVFSVPGEETLDILEALSRTEAIRHVTTRHEQGAAFMADVYGRLTGRAAVAMATLGPGATNLLTGIADAYLDRAPIVAITGQASSEALHKEAHQVVDVVDMFRPVTKWNARIERIPVIPEVVRKAFRVATLEKPGPTHIELPENVAGRDHRAGRPDPADQARPHVLPRADGRGDRPRRPAHQRIRAAARPRRERGAPTPRGALAPRPREGPPPAGGGDVHGQGRGRRPVAPVANGRRAAGARPRPDRVRPGGPRHRRGLRPRRVRALALEPGRPEADRPHRHAAGRGRRRIPAGGGARRGHPRRAGAAADRGEPGGVGGRNATQRHESRETLVHADLRTALLADLTACETDAGYPIKPQRALYELRRALGPEDIVVSDVGAHKIWIARLYQAYEPNTVVISNGFAAMGISLPGAIAAKLVHPDRKVVALCGDGGFLMNAQELETAKRIGAAVVVVVWRDDGYGLIDWKQRNEFGRPFAVEFGNPDIVDFARSFGIAGFRPESADDLYPTLMRALELGEPAVIDVPVDYRENVRLTERLGALSGLV